MIQIDMEMPKVCADCRFVDIGENEYPFCLVLRQHRGYVFDTSKKRFPNCPLMPVEEQKEDNETEKLKNMCRVLFNRCRAVGSGDGTMCIFCGMKKECEEMHSIRKAMKLDD